jgi:uncharacterized membrane protein
MSTKAVAGRRVRRWVVAVILLSLVGVADSSYLLWKHRSGGSARCPANGCNIVTQGEYAEIRGIPVAALGLVGYLPLLALSVLAVALGGRSLMRAIFAISGIGVVVSAFLVYLQVFVIRAVCPWCMLSAFTMTALFILSIVVLCKIRPLDQLESAGQQRA